MARLLAAEPAALRRFFRSDTSAVRLWFGHFSMEGMREFKHGALALARYALQRRDEVGRAGWGLSAWRRCSAAWQWGACLHVFGAPLNLRSGAAAA